MQAGETPRTASPEPGARSSGRSAIYSVELEVFEGPLDLLLHLVRRHELEILDIPIAFITVKYLEYLDFMRSLDLEIAGDYLVMAATLAWLKSRELLPSDKAPLEAGEDGEDEAEDPREALIRRLVEYERFKNAAADLDSLPMSGRDVFARGADIDIPPIDPGLAPVTLFKLAEAYYRVLTRAKINKSHDVQLEPITVAQRMTQLTLLLDQKQGFDFEGLFVGRTWNSERELRTVLVVTLMSILELVKLGVAGVQQIPDSDAIRVYRLEISEEARAVIETYDEAESFGDAGRPAPPPPPRVPSEAELDAAEESVLLAEALAGADDTDLGPDAGAAPAANSRELQTSPDLDEGAPELDDTIHADPEDSDPTIEPPGPGTQDADETLEPVDAQPSDAEPEAPEADEQAEAAPSDPDAAHETVEPEAPDADEQAEAAPPDHDVARETREPEAPEVDDHVEAALSDHDDAGPETREPEAPDADEHVEAAPPDHDVARETREPEAPAPSDHDDVAPETREAEAPDPDEHVEAREPREPEASADDTLDTSVAESEPEVDPSQPTDDRGPPAEPGQEDEA